MNIVKEIETQLNIPLYLVGGSLRDRLLGKQPKDWDFCTPMLPDNVENSIKALGNRAYGIGKRFGTVGCKFEIEGKQELIEITTFRNEVYDGVGRKPSVNFVPNLYEDLSRRDFTINSLAQGSTGRIVDHFGGVKDLEDRIIKCVGHPKHRFREDPLRILRSLRFASTLGFTIDDFTMQYMGKMKFDLLRISKERWVMELDKILLSPNPEAGLNIMQELGIMKVVLPELAYIYKYDQNNPHHSYDLWEHTLAVIKPMPKDINFLWAGLLHDIGKPLCRTENKGGYSNYINHELIGAEMALKISEHLKFSNERKDFIVETIKHHLEESSILKPYDNAGK